MTRARRSSSRPAPRGRMSEQGCASKSSCLDRSTLNTGLKIFLSREVTGSAGEDLVEKQNAEQGLMPVLEDEAGIYGYTLENRHMVECLRTGRQPMETFQDGVGVIEMLMAL